jgi:cytochrome d ubiquinol oxidase subunit II
VTLLFTAFPPAFARLTTVLHVPLVLLLLAIVGRGAAFVFQKHGDRAQEGPRFWDGVFALCSILAPLCLGVVLGAIAARPLPPPAGAFLDAFILSWLTPWTLLSGLFALSAVTWLAATYLWVEASGTVQTAFRRQAWWTGMMTHVLALAIVPVLMSHPGPVHAPEWNGLSFAGAGLVIAGMALWMRTALPEQARRARLLASGEMALLITGFAVRQYPALVYPDVTIWNAAAPGTTLSFLLGALLLGGVILFPSLNYLYRVFKREALFGDR